MRWMHLLIKGSASSVIFLKNFMNNQAKQLNLLWIFYVLLLKCWSIVWGGVTIEPMETWNAFYKKQRFLCKLSSLLKITWKICNFNVFHFSSAISLQGSYILRCHQWKILMFSFPLNAARVLDVACHEK